MLAEGVEGGVIDGEMIDGGQVGVDERGLFRVGEVGRLLRSLQ